MGFLTQWREERRYSKAAKRVAQMGSSDLHWWMESSLSSISRQARSPIPEVRQEAVREVETLYCVVQELIKRGESPLP